MEAELLNLSVVGVPKPDFLALHLHNALWALVDLFVIEGPHSDCNLDAICHLNNNYNLI